MMETCKVLVADDEPKIRRGLKAAVEALGPGWTVVAEAEDGERALELAAETRPDLLLVDIHMPILGGLELVEKLATVSTDCLVIIITGHDEFEFARQALKLRVFDYLLKPVSETQFRSVLDAAQAELEARRKTDLFLGWSQDQLETHLPLLREAFLRKVLGASLSESEVADNVGFLQIHLPQTCVMMAFHLVERVLGPGRGRENQRRLLLLNLKNLVSDAVQQALRLDLPAGASRGLGAWRHQTAGDSLPLVFEDESETILALLPALEDARLQALLAEVERKSGEVLHHLPSVAVGKVNGGLAGLAETHEALAAELLDRSPGEDFLRLVMNHLELHYRDPDLTLEAVAAEVQLSPGYLSRIMKQKTGSSFVDYLTRLRIKKATQLMSDPTARMFEVADLVGYRSQHYFSRAFRKVLGISPSEYRKGAGQ